MTGPPNQVGAGGVEAPPEPNASLASDDDIVVIRRRRHARWASPTAARVTAYSELPGTARAVLHAIGQATYERSGWASDVDEAELCDMTGFARSAVVASIRLAEASGELLVDRSRRPSRYAVTLGIHDDDVNELLCREARTDRASGARSAVPMNSEQSSSRREPIPLPSVDKLMPPPLTAEEQAAAAKAKQEAIAAAREVLEQPLPDHLSITVNKAGPADRRRRTRKSA